MKIIKELFSTIALAAVSLVSINIDIPDENISKPQKQVNAIIALKSSANAPKDSGPL